MVAEKSLTPLEKERLLIKSQKESLPVFDMRDDILAAIMFKCFYSLVCIFVSFSRIFIKCEQ